MEGIMPFETIAYLTFVLSAVAVFAAALTYADWASKRANGHVRKPDPAKQGRDHDAGALRKAA
jgi:hypothetical protein